MRLWCLKKRLFIRFFVGSELKWSIWVVVRLIKNRSLGESATGFFMVVVFWQFIEGNFRVKYSFLISNGTYFVLLDVSNGAFYVPLGRFLGSNGAFYVLLERSNGAFYVPLGFLSLSILSLFLLYNNILIIIIYIIIIYDI